MTTIAIVLNFNVPTSLPQSITAEKYQIGLWMVAGASMISGLSAALTQKGLVGVRKTFPFFYSAELAVFGIIFLLINVVVNNDIQGGSLFSNWNYWTLIPVVTNV